MRKLIVVFGTILISSLLLAADSIDKEFDKLDKNHDGSLSRKEFISGKVKINREKAVKLFPGIHDMKQLDDRTLKEKLFDMIDANHDGLLSRNEWRRVAPNVLEVSF
ncbi:MAG TPA: hypothetical protein VMJ66_13140 [Geobacteraceae bacterium]|nr:hypothetical protein [Geobacteraceae bacterium]